MVWLTGLSEQGSEQRKANRGPRVGGGRSGITSFDLSLSYVRRLYE